MWNFYEIYKNRSIALKMTTTPSADTAINPFRKKPCSNYHRIWFEYLFGFSCEKLPLQKIRITFHLDNNNNRNHWYIDLFTISFRLNWKWLAIKTIYGLDHWPYLNVVSVWWAKHRILHLLLSPHMVQRILLHSASTNA